MPWFATLTNGLGMKKQSTVNHGDWKKYEVLDSKRPEVLVGFDFACGCPFVQNLPLHLTRLDVVCLRRFSPPSFRLRSCFVSHCLGGLSCSQMDYPKQKIRASFPVVSLVMAPSILEQMMVCLPSGLVGRESAPTLPRGRQVTNHGHRCLVDGATAWKKCVANKQKQAHRLFQTKSVKE